MLKFCFTHKYLQTVTESQYWLGVVKIDFQWEKLPEFCVRIIGILWVVCTGFINPLGKLADLQMQKTRMNQSFLQKSVHSLSEFNISQAISNGIVFCIVKVLGILFCKCWNPVVMVDSIEMNSSSHEVVNLYSDVDGMVDVDLSPIRPVAQTHSGPRHSTPNREMLVSFASEASTPL